MRIPTLLAILTLTVLAGCGAASPQDEVRDVVNRFAAASAEKNYQVICDELLARTLVDNAEQYGLPCEIALKPGLDSVREPELTVEKITVKGDRASARVATDAANQTPSTVTLGLRRIADEWQITSQG